MRTIEVELSEELVEDLEAVNMRKDDPSIQDTQEFSNCAWGLVGAYMEAKMDWLNGKN